MYFLDKCQNCTPYLVFDKLKQRWLVDGDLTAANPEAQKLYKYALIMVDIDPV